MNKIIAKIKTTFCKKNEKIDISENKMVEEGLEILKKNIVLINITSNLDISDRQAISDSLQRMKQITVECVLYSK